MNDNVILIDIWGHTTETLDRHHVRGALDALFPGNRGAHEPNINSGIDRIVDAVENHWNSLPDLSEDEAFLGVRIEREG